VARAARPGQPPDYLVWRVCKCWQQILRFILKLFLYRPRMSRKNDGFYAPRQIVKRSIANARLLRITARWGGKVGGDTNAHTFIHRS
jgi:hypothetical protein